MRSSIALLGVVFSGLACAPENTIGVRFRSEAIRRATLEMRTFVFAADDPAFGGGPPPSCEQLDPRGMKFGDAEERSGQTATWSKKGKLEDTIAEFEDLSKGQYTLVIEGWGPPCIEATTPSGNNDEPACSRLSTTGTPVMRAYACTPIDLSADTRTDIDLQLETFATIGSTMRVPTAFPVEAIWYDEANPQPVVDGLLGHDRFIVQLLNDLNEAVDEVEVNWSVSFGSGSIDGPETMATGEDERAGDHGLSSTYLRAGATASGIEMGAIAVEAYAPGYEGSPITFTARAVRGVEISLDSFRLPTSRIDLAGTNPEFRLVMADDLDGNGKADIAVVGGRIGRCLPTVEARHQLAVLYGDESGGFHPTYSAEVPKQAMALTSLHMGQGRRAILVSTSSWCSFYEQISTGSSTYVLQQPAIEVWAPLDDVPGPGDEVLRASRRELTQTTRCVGSNCEPGLQTLTKGAIAIDTADIDGDGIDEIAMSRCSYMYAPAGGQVNPVVCHGDLADRSDSELVVMTAELEGLGVGALYERATIGETGGDGGFREVRLADISGDGSLDLVAATQTEVAVFCGRRNMPDTGYGFGLNPQRWDKPNTFAQGFSVGAGRFNGDDRADALVTGGLRAASPNSGMKLNPGADCGFEEGPGPILAGPRTEARFLIVRVADLNADGRDDAILLHRETRLLETYFGSGTDQLARGPTITLPAGVSGELGLYVENPGENQIALAATTAPDDNLVFALRLKPAPRAN